MAINIRHGYPICILNVVTGAVDVQHLVGKSGENGRGIYVHLSNGYGDIFSPSGESVKLQSLKPNGEKVLAFGLYDGNRIRVDFPSSMFSMNGIVKCQLTLEDQGGKIKTSDTFFINVKSI